jgi:GNAT superfamily N-acetyltransferase
VSAAIRRAQGEADAACARRLFLEYQVWLGISLCFQDFDRELATLPGAYAPPGGALLIAHDETGAFGCVALRPLAGDVGEVKRLYVRGTHRGGGWGRRLMEAVIAEARAIGYRSLKLDTLPKMEAAQALYQELGFTPCPAYYDNPIPGALYLERLL